MPASTGNTPRRKKPESDAPALDSPMFESVVQRFQNEFQIERDICAEIAHALFIGNRQAIYAAFGRKLMEGNVKVLDALANRAYGMPRQTMVQSAPFRLEIVHVGSNKQPEALEVHVKGELPSGNEVIEGNAARATET